MTKLTSRTFLRMALVVVIAYGLYLNLYGAFGEFQPWLLLFYTTLSNALVLLLFIYLCAGDLRRLLGGRISDDASSAGRTQKIKIALTWALSITGIVWHVLLAPELEKQTQAEVNAVMMLSFSLLHTWSPLLTFADWLLFDSKNIIQRLAPVRWLLIPIAYFIFICFWVNLVGPVNLEYGLTYPYPFIDFQANGVTKTWLTISVILIGMLGLGYLYVGLDRILGKTTGRFKSSL